MHTFKMFWNTIGCKEKHRDLSEGPREDMGDKERVWAMCQKLKTAFFSFAVHMFF
jgi:hypothetical protein